jgi:NitT/TauT family transport system ATP-binding protein
MGITVLFVTHNIDDAVYSASGASDVVVTDRDHGEYLPDERPQLKMRSLARFAELRKHLYEQIQAAKQVQRPA